MLIRCTEIPDVRKECTFRMQLQTFFEHGSKAEQSTRYPTQGVRSLNHRRITHEVLVDNVTLSLAVLVPVGL